MGLAMSLRDGSVNLSNTWTRQLSDTTHGNVSYVSVDIYMPRSLKKFFSFIATLHPPPPSSPPKQF